MKKLVHLVPMVLALLLLCACDKNAEVKQFMTDLTAAIEKNDKAAIEKMYPAAAKADSLALAFDAEKAQIEALEDGSIKIALGEGKDITLVKNEGDGSLSVKESHGVFVYPQERMDFALKTGWYDKTLDDIKNADRLADTLFVKYLNDKIAGAIIADLKSKVKVTKSVYTNFDINSCRTSYLVVVSNQSNRQIEGDEYVVISKVYSTVGFGFSRNRISLGNRTLTGKPIPANGQVSYTFSTDDGVEPENPVSTISVNPKIENVLADYQPTGKEYEEYLSQKAN